jgi:hypothetical protein
MGYRPIPSTVAAAAVLLSLAGCGQKPQASAPEDQLARSELGEIWEMYDGYVLQNKKPPTSVADFRGFRVAFPRGHAAMTSGGVVVRFGTPVEPAGKVLAYHKDVPSKGGLVLLNDGSLKSMTADEVQAAIK